MYKTVEFRKLSDRPQNQLSGWTIQIQGNKTTKLRRKMRCRDGTNLTHKNAAVRTGVPNAKYLLTRILLNYL